MLNQTCKNEWCKQPFTVTDEDLAFYEKVSPVFGDHKEIIPPPTRCPACRLQRRMSSPNVRHLYSRDCGLCGKSTVTAYSKDKQLVVYCQQCWWGDSWNELDYGREMDFSRPFFDQMKELQLVVPRLALMNKAPENSEYCNYAGFNKNCYLAVFGSWYNEDCYYGTYFDHSKNSVDCSFLKQGELCYECMFGSDLYRCAMCVDCANCSDCLFSLNLKGCKNCLLCSNLRNKEYCIENQQVTKEEFEKVRASLSGYQIYQTYLQRFHEWRATSLRPANYMINCENCTGDYLRSCKNIHDAYIATDVEDGKHLFSVEYSKDCMDCSLVGYDNTQLFYECVTAGIAGQRNQFCFQNWSCNDLLYCDTPQSSSSCFGCICVRRKQYCILNKQYTKEEYEELVPKIIKHMRQTGEWGEFFSPDYLPFAYNETLAQEYFPLSKDDVLSHNWKWHEDENEMPKVARILSASDLSDDINEVTDEVTRCAIECESTRRPFKIIKQELDFYRTMQLPLPRLHHDERNKRRTALHNSPQFYSRACSRCSSEIVTTYSPDRPEIVYCERCYLESVY